MHNSLISGNQFDCSKLLLGEGFMKRKLKVVSAIGLILVLFIVLLFFWRNNKHYEFNSKISFSEMINARYTVTDNEKLNINTILEQKKYIDDQYFGFSSVEKGIEFYKVYQIVRGIELLNINLGEYTDRIKFIQDTSVENLEILDVIYYVYICNKFNIVFDSEKVYQTLQKYYDTDSNLFFMNDADDYINIKLVLTAMCLENIPDLRFDSRFDIEKGIKRAYENYEFKTDKDTTFYNSGADIVYCYNVIGLWEEKYIERHKEWFEYWKKFYESIQLDGFDSALAYQEFYKIAIIFDENYSNNKLEKFYNQLSESSLSESEDILVVINSIQHTKELKNEAFNASLEKEIKRLYESEELFTRKIDLQETVYGIALSINTGYSYDSNKLQNYINDNYTYIERCSDITEKCNYLYYNLMLDELNNNYNVSCNEDLIQRSVNEVLNGLYYKTSFESDINSARKIIEIVMDMQIHNVEVNITHNQRNRISGAIEKAEKGKIKNNSQFAIDVYLLTEYLELDFDNSSLFNEDINNMVIGYQIQTCMEMENPLIYLEPFKTFANDMCIEEGIYGEYTVEEKKEYTLASILFGNAISKLSYGGEKDDIY